MKEIIQSKEWESGGWSGRGEGVAGREGGVWPGAVTGARAKTLTVQQWAICATTVSNRTTEGHRTDGEKTGCDLGVDCPSQPAIARWAEDRLLSAV